MKTKIIGLLLIAFASTIVSANTLTKRKVQMGTWRNSTRAPVSMPIDVFIEENNSILIKFIKYERQPITLQIRDTHGNIIFQDLAISSEGKNYKIDLNGFKKGKYELFYLSEQIVISGEFRLE